MSPIRVDFYLLNDSLPETRWGVSCRLLAKAYQGGHRVFVCCNNQEDALLLDERLWTYQEDSFVPHALEWENLEPTPAIQIGCDLPANSTVDLVLNLASTTPFCSPNLRRIMEIVPAEDAARALSRDHYRIYRSHQFELHTHTI